jgi:hypothetical protein
MMQLASRDPEVERKLRGLPEIEVEEGRAWRRAISCWIAAVCLSAIVGCWLQKPLPGWRYEVRQAPRPGGSQRGDFFYRFDRHTGELVKIQ